MSMKHTIPAASNCAVLFLDLQEEIVKNARTLDGARILRHAGVLAKVCALHGVPAFASAVPPGGEYAKDVIEPLGLTPRMRMQTTAFADASIVADLKAGGRRVLVLAGVASEIVVQRTALDALAADYDVLVAVDACGGISDRTEQAAWQRIGAAGGQLTSVTTFAGELAGDFSTEMGGKTLALMYETLGG
jgi:nicotinamidase-related amidase